jgi:hypothetical protein
LGCGQFIELKGATLSSSLRSGVQPLSFRVVEKAISKYILEDKDSDTFVSLFTPLMQVNVSFESTMCENIDRYKNPPAVNEHSLQTLLSMGERWLFERARHEVSIIPGNYRASLLQFDSQDMGEVSQNLTYNFRHREQTILPELKYLLSFLWRSQLPFLVTFRNACNIEHPYFVARLLSTCFHEQTSSVFHHPIIIQFTLARLFRKSALDNALTMVGAGQNASVCAAILSLLRSAVCSSICSAPTHVDAFASQIVRQSQRCRTANILSPMIRRLRELERRKKKKRMVTVDETGLIAVDGFEVERKTWSSFTV